MTEWLFRSSNVSLSKMGTESSAITATSSAFEISVEEDAELFGKLPIKVAVEEAIELVAVVGFIEEADMSNVELPIEDTDEPFII